MGVQGNRHRVGKYINKATKESGDVFDLKAKETIAQIVKNKSK